MPKFNANDLKYEDFPREEAMVRYIEETEPFFNELSKKYDSISMKRIAAQILFMLTTPITLLLLVAGLNVVFFDADVGGTPVHWVGVVFTLLFTSFVFWEMTVLQKQWRQAEKDRYDAFMEKAPEFLQAKLNSDFGGIGALDYSLFSVFNKYGLKKNYSYELVDVDEGTLDAESDARYREGALKMMSNNIYFFLTHSGWQKAFKK